jgi:DNA helicase-2/ATP-dependent DNA helicase PcrA
MPDVSLNPAEQAAALVTQQVHKCVDEGKSFLLEAGAGAGKTYSLIDTLQYIIKHRGPSLARQRQQVACITYTNVATDEIRSRTDGHPVILASTIHSFCWSLIRGFQPVLREKLPQISKWPERLAEAGDIGGRRIDYDLGHPAVRDDYISLGHDDVITLMVALMGYEKFRRIFAARHPILLIDEYQDTNREFYQALATHFIARAEGPLIGFFGDHWQKIYDGVCGKIDPSGLVQIGKGANFRSAPAIVEALNLMRPELPQKVRDPQAQGSVVVYHTNDWQGTRLTGQHWGGDLPTEVAREYRGEIMRRLIAEGWSFVPMETKVLMLTHRVLAAEQGYSALSNVFDYSDSLLKKEDSHIAFFADTLEPVCVAYGNKRYGNMFEVLGTRTPAICTHADKVGWTNDMDRLMELRKSATVGAIVDFLKISLRPRLPEAVATRERELELWDSETMGEEPSSLKSLRALRGIAYSEITAAVQFINDMTPFSTKHGVKGAEFENVLVVFGRGWNRYDFNQFLELAGMGRSVPAAKADFFERNRNLFYVVCSRPKKRLALLFTQKLTDSAMTTLAHWFGSQTIHSIQTGS